MPEQWHKPCGTGDQIDNVIFSHWGFSLGAKDQRGRSPVVTSGWFRRSPQRQSMLKSAMDSEDYAAPIWLHLSHQFPLWRKRQGQERSSTFSLLRGIPGIGRGRRESLFSEYRLTGYLSDQSRAADWVPREVASQPAGTWRPRRAYPDFPQPVSRSPSEQSEPRRGRPQ